MARATVELIAALRRTAERLRTDASYQWGHMGECNCGHLVQTITARGRGEIHAAAMAREGDWEQQARDYCPASGLAIDDIITELVSAGMSIHDIGHLEKLSDPKVLRSLPGGVRHLRHNHRDDVVLYMITWADVLAAALPLAARSIAA